jgi:hypothetical protein
MNNRGALADRRDSDERTVLYAEACQLVGEMSNPQLRAVAAIELLSYLPSADRPALARAMAKSRISNLSSAESCLSPRYSPIFRIGP